MTTQNIPAPSYPAALVLACFDCGATDGLSRWEDDDPCPVCACHDSAACLAHQDAQADALAAERWCGYCLDIVGPDHRCADWIVNGVATGAFKNVEHYHATRE